MKNVQSAQKSVSWKAYWCLVTCLSSSDEARVTADGLPLGNFPVYYKVDSSEVIFVIKRSVEHFTSRLVQVWPTFTQILQFQNYL